jgi:hypothetical protein
VTFSIYNSGTDDVTIDKIRVGSTTPTDIVNVAISAGGTGDAAVTHTVTSGVKYYYEIITTTGNVFPYTATAP